jgi:outer membrane protein assembly factor BamE (lipoprotein component of BamABCDE complex)
MLRAIRVGGLKLFWFAGLTAVALAGCVTESDPDSYPPRLRAGMSREDLRACFGAPLRIEAADGGGENWYYTFIVGDIPQANTTTSYDYSGTRTDSISVTLPDTQNKQELPVRLSPEGYVLEPIPDGHIVRK